MSFYSRYVLPRFTDFAMSRRAIAAERARLIPRAAGIVLEIGAGSALNVPYYGPAVRKLYAIDPSLELWRLGRRRADGVRLAIEFLRASATGIPLRAHSVDTVVSTWTLCTIPDPRTALREMRRVLRPDGTLLFIEHGSSPEPHVRAWQARLTPLWKRIAGGCHLDREIERLLADAGFDVSMLERGYGEGPKPFVYLYRGVASPPRAVNQELAGAGGATAGGSG